MYPWHVKKGMPIPVSVGDKRKGRKMPTGENCANYRHGHATDKKSPEYRTWRAMVSRCGNPKATAFERYGGRGIKVCERWLQFENFLADMGARPEGKTLDRRDNDKGYEPDNCRWATPKEQQQNRRARSNQHAVVEELREGLQAGSQDKQGSR